MHAGKSFGISTAREFLEQLVHESQKELNAHLGSPRAMIAAAIFCWHLHDWIWAQHKDDLHAKLGLKDKSEFVKFLLGNCEELEAMQGIATGSKHAFTERKRNQPTSTAHGWVAEGWVAEGWVDMTPNVEFRGKSFRFIDIFNTCVKSWDEFFQKYMP